MDLNFRSKNFEWISLYFEIPVGKMENVTLFL